MKSAGNNQKKRRNILLISIVASLILLGTIINGSLIKFELVILDFAAHHYFILAFIIILVALLFVKTYLLKNVQDNNPGTLDKISKQVEISKVEYLRFKETDVLNNREDLEVRQKQILLSVRLGFLLRKKVVIFFTDESSKLHIKTEVIKKEADSLLLKGNIKLPIKSIYRIELPRD